MGSLNPVFTVGRQVCEPLMRHLGLSRRAALARALGISRITPYRWEYARPYGTDGLIPNAMVARVQAAAKAEGIELTPADWEPTLISYPTPLFPEYLS